MTQDKLPEADGVLETADGEHAVLRFRRTIAHPVERVWAALTDPAELAWWWGQAEVDLVEGGKFVLRWLNADDCGNRAEMHATITRLDPPRLLETTGDLHGVLRWELRPAEGGSATLLSFSSTLQLPAEYRSRTLAGWHWHLDALAGFLGGTPADLVNVTGWDRVHQRYA
jgi:uncharacterized protein YndB with AHSA1/START domain